MMSVNEFFYGNQATPTQIIKTSTVGPVKQQQQQHPPYGTQYTLFSHDATLSRDDYDAVYSRNYSNSNYSNLDPYNSRYQQYQQESQLHHHNSRYPTSTYVTSSALQYDNSSFGMSNSRQNNLSKDFSSQSNYGPYGSRGSIPRPVSTFVELKVPVCCEGCEERVTNHLLELPGVEAVSCDKMRQKVVVRGTAAPADVLRVCMKLFKRSEFWRYQFDWL